MMNIQLTQYAWFKPSRVIGITLSVAILFAPFQLLAQGDDAPPKDDCQPQITSAKPSGETSQKWYLFSTPCDVPDGWIKADNDQICADVVVYAQNPTSQNWFTFVTPCDVPEGWSDPVLIKPSNIGAYQDCSMTPQTGYAQSPKTTNWYEFANLCDAPLNWNPTPVKPEQVKLLNPQVVDCPLTLTYAQHPTSKHWYAFATPCEVPVTWEKVGVVQQEEESTGKTCEAFYASYSADGHLNIPRVSFGNLLFKDIGLLQVGGIGSLYFLFSFEIESLPMPTETK